MSARNRIPVHDVSVDELLALQTFIPEMWACLSCGRLVYRYWCSAECFLAGKSVSHV